MMASGDTDSLILLILQRIHGTWVELSWRDVPPFADELVLHSSVYKLNVEISLGPTTNHNATTDASLILFENLLLFLVWYLS
jgi:hypothetical protein